MIECLKCNEVWHNSKGLTSFCSDEHYLRYRKSEEERLKLTNRTPPNLFSEEEKERILKKAETLFLDLQSNNLGGYSGINRPFWILHVFKEVIEEFGNRDVGLLWTFEQLQFLGLVQCSDDKKVF